MSALRTLRVQYVNARNCLNGLDDSESATYVHWAALARQLLHEIAIEANQFEPVNRSEF